MKKIFSLFVVFIYCLCKIVASAEIDNNIKLNPNPAPHAISPQDIKLINWIKNHVSPRTGLPLSFDVPLPYRQRIFAEMGEADSVPAIIERNIVDEGFVIYDGALWQIALTCIDNARENLERASIPIKYYWDGSLKDLVQIRSGFPASNFVYDKSHPDVVSSDLTKRGLRGFLFRILNAHGRYLLSDPLDGKTAVKNFPNLETIHWEDWKPIAGENAWVVIAAMHIYHKKYFDCHSNNYRDTGNTVELNLAKEISRAAMILQSENGGVRMAPSGTYRNPQFDPQTKAWQSDNISPEDYEWHYNEISTENNVSWYAAFRFLYQATHQERYLNAMKKIENYLRQVWDKEHQIFCQGMHYQNGSWTRNTEYFAVDVQNLAIAVLGPKWIDDNFNEGTAYKIWRETKSRAGFLNLALELEGVGYTDEHDRISIEWTCMAIFALRALDDYYRSTHPDWAREAREDAARMRQGISRYRYAISENEAAYAYSSRRGWIPWGWFSHEPEVLSMASTCWVILVDMDISPFILPCRNSGYF